MKAPLLLAVAALTALAGCGGRPEPRTVPNVMGQRLDAAETNLDAAGLDSKLVGGGIFGVVLHSRWRVCSQRPRAGSKAVEVTLIVSRACESVASRRRAVVPDVEYKTLPEAEDELLDTGLGWSIEADSRVLVPSHWDVCDQYPAAGGWADSVQLYVEKDCDDWD